MRVFAIILAAGCFAFAADPKVVVKPDAFETLVNPNCSHCVDEAKRRKDELKDADPVLMWTRGKYEGGAIPIRFFLNPYRVISDTYGVFVYDPDAGFSRGFKASVDFRFHGWRNGVMTMKHKDGTVFSCLTGLAFEGPRKGERIETWPTVVGDWGWSMKHYPNGVAYHMFEKYKPTELPNKPNADSVASRGPADPRVPADELVLGVDPAGRANPRAFRLGFGDKKSALVKDVFECGRTVYVLYQAEGNLVSAYGDWADKIEATDKLSVEGKVLDRKQVELVLDGVGDGLAPFKDTKSGSRFDAVGRCLEGELKGWTLRPFDSVRVKWFAWSAEYPRTRISTESPAPKPAEPKPEPPAKVDPKDTIKEVAGTSEFLRAIPKKFATIVSSDPMAKTVTLKIEGETAEKAWPLTPDAEVRVAGWWGRIEQLPKGGRVWAWFHTDRKKTPTSVFLIADEPSERDIHGTKPADDVAAKRTGQQSWLQETWEKNGLPGTITFVHLAGEVDVMIDHEAMRWARSLKLGDKVTLAADPPIAAVVKDVKPYRERTQVRVVVNGLDIAELATGQRTLLKMPTPSKDVLANEYPPDIGRTRTKEERVDWFLASIYCSCPVKGDICTGDFYTLASCNPNGCGLPNSTRREIGKFIDKGLDDKSIWDKLRADRGPLMTKSHLEP